MEKVIKKALRFVGKPKIPGDKSISHRALILGALAHGETQITNLLDADDVRSTAQCLKDLGVNIWKNGPITRVMGLGRSEFTPPQKPLDCGNSGTTIRLLMGVLAGRNLTVELTGDESLKIRPMKRVSAPLTQMGAQFQLTHENHPPIRVIGASLRGTIHPLQVASAQVKSSILLAALSAQGSTYLLGKIHSRDHTERLLTHFGVPIKITPTQISVPGGHRLQGTHVNVPGDPSSAAFWIAAACLIPGAELEIESLSLNPTRIGFLRALQNMGANLFLEMTSESPEPIGKVRVSHPKGAPCLLGTTVQPEDVPTLIDELPLLAVVATQATGTTRVRGAEELRVKETDRIEALATNLRAMGIEITVYPDGFEIQGPQTLQPAVLQSFHDHRIAMAFSIAGLLTEGPTVIQDAQCVAISYPQFFETLEELTPS